MVSPNTCNLDFNLDIAGLTFNISLPFAEWRNQLETLYKPFVVNETGLWHVQSEWKPDLDYTDTPRVSYKSRRTEFRIAACRGWLDLASRRACIIAPSLADTLSAIERVLVYICVQTLPSAGLGLLLHGAGVAIDGQGLAFVGPSGAGKTTIATLATGFGQVLCDENIIVKIGVNGPTLCSTPFWGHSTPPQLIRRRHVQAPLRAICILQQARTLSLRRLSQPEAVLALLKTEKVALDGREQATAWLGMAGRVAASVPIYQLGFIPSAELWPYLKRALV